jgi:spore coat protein CotF
MNDIKFWLNTNPNYPKLENFLINCKNNIYGSLYILDKLINKFAFKIYEDNIKNDIRNLYLSSYIFGKINIITSFVFDNNLNKKEYIELNYNYSDKNICDYAYFANY